MENIGIIGAGVMGLTVAEKIVATGHRLAVYDVSANAVRRAGKIGAQVAQSPSEVGRISDIILLFLPGPAEVTECVTSADGLLDTLKPGKAIVDMTSAVRLRSVIGPCQSAANRKPLSAVNRFLTFLPPISSMQVPPARATRLNC
ncbi:MAG: NAD(P)-binding domain-containing protein [Desulfobacterales bacterium]